MQIEDSEFNTLEARWGINEHVFMHIFRKIASEKKFPAHQGEYYQIIDTSQRKLCLLSI